MGKIKCFARFVAAAIAVVLLAGMTPIAAWAASEDRTVRIGYIDYEGFIQENSDGIFSGYGVEVLEKIAENTGWRFEFVYDTWANHLESLKTGDIDFVCHAQRTAGREQSYLFSRYSDGAGSSILYVRHDDDRYYYSDYENFDGMRIGFFTGSFQAETFAEFAENYDFSYIAEENSFA